ncbi:MAG: GNAT family N-acetyltransferase [Verrucomicrobia bacterium]|nr:GNAT family N-acetyltransferase [Verrucomicrobiota bacterium]
MTNDYRSLVLAAGEKYRLVPIDVSFTEALFEAVHESRGELMHFVSWYYPEYSIEDARRWLQARERERSECRAYDFAITDVQTGELVGGCGIDRIQTKDRQGNLYYWVRTSRKDEGAATAAAAAVASFGLSSLHLIRLEIVVAETNFVAQSVAEKIGASREIRLPNRLILGGQIQHAYLFSLLDRTTESKR